jgi:hypothetical protein
MRRNRFVTRLLLFATICASVVTAEELPLTPTSARADRFDCRLEL